MSVGYWRYYLQQSYWLIVYNIGHKSSSKSYIVSCAKDENKQKEAGIGEGGLFSSLQCKIKNSKANKTQTYSWVVGW